MFPRSTFALVIAGAAALLASSVAFAQLPPTTQPTTARDRLTIGLPRSYHHSVAREIMRAVKLSDEQIDALAALTDHHQQTATAHRRTARQLRNKLAEMRAAERNGDEATTALLESQVESLRRARGEQAAEGDPYELYMDDVDSLMTPEQRPTFAAFQTRFLEREFFGGRIQDLIENLPKTLEITPEQQATYDAMRAKLRSQVPKPRWAVADPTGFENDLFAAEESGDYETADAMRQKANLVTPNGRTALEAFFNELEPTLSPDQRFKLMQVRQSSIDPIHAQQLSVKTLLRTARRLKLTSEQEEQLRTVEGEQLRKSRSLQRGDDESAQSLSRETRTRIEQVLTAEQKTEFSKLIAHASSRDDR